LVRFITLCKVLGERKKSASLCGRKKIIPSAAKRTNHVVADEIIILIKKVVRL
jgi:hypothetical protein